jgi:hypothetical protein
MKFDSSMVSVLHLNLHREFFSKIAAGTKRAEYRSQMPYWKTRLENRKYDVVQFRNGYATKAPEMLVEFLGVRKYGKDRNAYYAIRPPLAPARQVRLGRILQIKRWS